MFRRRGWLPMLLLAGATACHEAPSPPPPPARPPPPLGPVQKQAAFPDGVSDLAPPELRRQAYALNRLAIN
ncbi:MAG TPA: hypothetical protein VFN45_03190, partial [Myxococcaceae bacterium]|nr:hypothetical protein [Myxococcaceae bacterium]